jgi:hypothetical protein
MAAAHYQSSRQPTPLANDSTIKERLPPDEMNGLATVNGLRTEKLLGANSKQDSHSFQWVSERSARQETMTTFAEQQPTELIASEEELVSKWRLDQFLTLGFSDENACLLAESDVDLNRARSLVAAECPLTVALQILI